MAQEEGILADLQIIIYNRLVVFQLCTKASCSFYQFVSAFVNTLESKTQIEMGEMEKNKHFLLSTHFGSNNKRIFWVSESLELRKLSFHKGGSAVWLIHSSLLLSRATDFIYLPHNTDLKHQVNREIHPGSMCVSEVCLNTALVSWQRALPRQRQTAVDIWIGGSGYSCHRLHCEKSRTTKAGCS